MKKHISDLIVSMLGAVDRGFESWSGQNIYYKIGMCCSSVKLSMRNSKYWFDHYQVNVSAWGDMSIHKLLFSELAL